MTDQPRIVIAHWEGLHLFNADDIRNHDANESKGARQPDTAELRSLLQHRGGIMLGRVNDVTAATVPSRRVGRRSARSVEDRISRRADPIRLHD